LVFFTVSMVLPITLLLVGMIWSKK
jgi:hypothetical protein